jgi:hypothetical protein
MAERDLSVVAELRQVREHVGWRAERLLHRVLANGDCFGEAAEQELQRKDRLAVAHVA